MSSTVQESSTRPPRSESVESVLVAPAALDVQVPSSQSTPGKEVMDMTESVDPGGQDKPVPPPAALTQARADAQRFLKDLDVPSDRARELARIVDSAIDERFGELHDLRIGRVIGAALATL